MVCLRYRIQQSSWSGKGEGENSMRENQGGRQADGRYYGVSYSAVRYLNFILQVQEEATGRS